MFNDQIVYILISNYGRELWEHLTTIHAVITRPQTDLVQLSLESNTQT